MWGCHQADSKADGKADSKADSKAEGEASRFTLADTEQELREIAAFNKRVRQEKTHAPRTKKEIAQKLFFLSYPHPENKTWNVSTLNEFCAKNAIKL